MFSEINDFDVMMTGMPAPATELSLDSGGSPRLTRSCQVLSSLVWTCLAPAALDPLRAVTEIHSLYIHHIPDDATAVDGDDSNKAKLI